jgi:hypothetical protein
MGVSILNASSEGAVGVVVKGENFFIRMELKLWVVCEKLFDLLHIFFGLD